MKECDEDPALHGHCALPEKLRAMLCSHHKVLSAINGDESWELPVPAINVIARKESCAMAHLDGDYRKRLAPEAIAARFAGA